MKFPFCGINLIRMLTHFLTSKCKLISEKCLRQDLFKVIKLKHQIFPHTKSNLIQNKVLMYSTETKYFSKYKNKIQPYHLINYMKLSWKVGSSLVKKIRKSISLNKKTGSTKNWKNNKNESIFEQNCSLYIKKLYKIQNWIQSWTLIFNFFNDFSSFLYFIWS